ncbi:hypothetical protein TBC1_1235 [Lentimicrobium saccharophilum]|uniref:Uncharacterized protein n=1 Tax=Lentimicrobium saccharophilum TaxID=1678841 RepID=A0A0S7BTR2_9BACT|nr:hypothetical protein TBC1_1235 [Lentimicrobium saccharophilum]
MAGDVQVIFVHQSEAEGKCNNLRFFQPKRSPVFSHFWEALFFWYFWTCAERLVVSEAEPSRSIKPKVQELKKR